MIKCKITSLTNEAIDIKSFVLEPVDGTSLPDYEAGSHIDVHVNHEFVRQYSLIRDPDLKNQYKIAVLKDKNSRGGSELVHQLFEMGYEINISEPRNLFPLVADAEHYILFAGGIGITPILSMALSLNEQGKSFEMHYCARSTEHLAFKRFIENSAISSKCTFHLDDVESSKLNIQNILAQPEPDQHIFVCGPGGFIDFLHESALSLGWKSQQYHQESFKNVIDHGDDESFELVLAQSQKILLVPADKSALEVLLDHDFEVDSSCEQGICGTCVMEVLEGEVEHHDQFLTDEEKASNKMFTPCCSRAKSKQLVVNL